MNREAKAHDLKTVPPYFDHVWNGDKNFEFRKDDRGFRVMDVLRLREFVPPGSYTGRIITARVDYILEGFAGMEAGYCIMGITVLFRNLSPTQVVNADDAND